MRTLVCVLAVAACCATFGALPASAAIRSCPNVSGAEVIGTRGVSCAVARRVARRWVSEVAAGGSYDRRVLGFRCRNRPSQIEGDTIHCVNQRRTIRWYPNADGF